MLPRKEEALIQWLIGIPKKGVVHSRTGNRPNLYVPLTKSISSYPFNSW